MNHLKYLLLFIGIAIFASCSESDVEGGIIDDANQANFTGSIGELQTRVTDNSWDTSDAIGIYALKADNSLSDVAIFNGKSNIKYTTKGNGSFASAGAPINFPETGSLDFISYYPFQTMIADYKYNIDVSSQSDLSAIDLLYSNNAKGESIVKQNVNLEFKHMLSKLILNVDLGNDVASLQGLNASVNDIIVDGVFALANGTTIIGNTKRDISLNVNIAADKKSAIASAIVVPGQNLQDAEFVFFLGKNKFEWTPTSQELASSMKYSYSFKLTLDDSGLPTIVPVKATISDWIDGYIGDEYIDLTPEQEDSELITIDELLTEYANSGQDTWTITEPFEIKAVVTSDRVATNSTSPKNGYLQDEAGTALAFRVDETAHEFDMGDEITIGLSDAVISKYGGSIQIAFSTTRAEVIDTDIVIEPKVLTIEEALEGLYDAKLVKIENIQFDDYEDLTYYSEDDKSITDRTLIDTNGNTIIVGTSKNATFKDELLPKGKGDIVGIMSVFFGKWQLNIRNLDDVQISDDESTRFDAPSLTTDIDRAIIAKEAGEQTIAITTNVEWTATTDASWLTVNPTSGNNDATVALSATANNAKEARMAEVTITAPNHMALSPIVITISQKGTNDGSKENPYSVAEAIALQGEKDVWVQGYIVGSIVNNRYVFSASGAAGSNIIIANKADETDKNNVIPVQLPTGSARTDLNLEGNPDKYKKEVIIKGDLEAYFGTEGLKNAKEYELATEGGETPDPVVFTTDKSAIVFNATTELTNTIKLTTDPAQAWTLTASATWLTLTPEAGGTGSTDITLTAAENTAETERTATVTITPTDNTDLTPVVVTVTQNGKLTTGGDVATDLFISEYVEGGSFNKYIEIYNGTGATVDLSDYKIESYNNGVEEANSSHTLSGALPSGAVLVLKHDKATIYDGAATVSATVNFNGDDALALIKISTGGYLDIIGRIGERTEWDAGGDLKTKDRTLVRKSSVRGGVTVNPAEGFPTLATEWIGYPKDTAEYLGSHTMN